MTDIGDPKPFSGDTDSAVRINVVSVMQPWAAALFFGKDIENRTWTHDHLGPICIHASKTNDPSSANWARCMKLLGKEANKPAFGKALNAHGAIIGVRELDGIIAPPANPMEGTIADMDQWAEPGQHHWVFSPDNKVLFKRPIAAKGMLGIWSVDARVIAEVLASKGEPGIPPWLRDDLPEPMKDEPS